MPSCHQNVKMNKELPYPAKVKGKDWGSGREEKGVQ